MVFRQYVGDELTNANAADVGQTSAACDFNE